MKKILLLSLLMMVSGIIGAQQPDNPVLSGKVFVDEDKSPLPGATIVVSGTTFGAVTGNDGIFSFNLPKGEYKLKISYIGFETQLLTVNLPLEDTLEIYLGKSEMDLSEVQVVSTGFEKLPKERATGSFVQVDNELLNRRISTNILERLEDITPGLIFNRSGTAADRISIRGRSTIFSNAQPLVIIDNFPYDGPIENINPNDVESITVLRDAAAASIWGARAGNGVIVINTKRGDFGKEMKVSLNTNINVVKRPDPFYVPLMGPSDFLDNEIRLFGQGFYRSLENSPSRAPLTPAIEILIMQRDGLISETEAQQRLENLRNQDIRNDIRDHLYRESVFQQHALNIRGGSGKQNYFLSAGFDKNLEELVGNEFNRWTLNAGQTFRLAKDKIQIGTGIYFTRTNRVSNNPGPNAFSMTTASLRPYPYGRLMDENGNRLPLTNNFREPFKRTAESIGLLPWDLIPLSEIELLDNRTVSNDIRLNTDISYNINDNFKAALLYQYWSNSSQTNDFAPQQSYRARDLINRFTQVSANGDLSYPVPMGGILDHSDRSSNSHNLRLQLNYSKKWDNRHELTALGGYEIKTLQSLRYGTRFYGYDKETGANNPVDFVSLFPQFQNNATRNQIPFGSSTTGQVDNFLSVFANAAYTFKNRYILSASARRDASNLFGVATNQKWVPLWSAGLGWIVNEEGFYRSGFLPYLKLRATYGENGNVDKNVSALTTARVFGTARFTGLREAVIVSAPNPDLRWERIRILNLATDFETKDGILSGSVEWYRKEGLDLIGVRPFAPSTGYPNFRGNFASTLTKGLDLQLGSWVYNRKFRWRTDMFYSHVNEIVTDYEIESPAFSYLSQGAGAGSSVVITPQKGRPLFAVYSLPWAGLDPDNGNPLGILDGEPSANYSALINNNTPSSLIYNGPSRPVTFGAWRNTFSYGGLSVSMNISYRFGYYYRRQSVLYEQVLTGLQAHGDYALRWQQPGDERITQVPSIPGARNPQRDNFYTYSEALVEKGDHIRFQDINISYTWNRSENRKLPFQKLEVYSYLNNIGILWKASDDPLDPDFRTMKPLRSFTAGIRIDF